MDVNTKVIVCTIKTKVSNKGVLPCHSV